MKGKEKDTLEWDSRGTSLKPPPSASPVCNFPEVTQLTMVVSQHYQHGAFFSNPFIETRKCQKAIRDFGIG